MEDIIVEDTKEFTFDAAHYLNEYVGACSEIHGHTYWLKVTIRGKESDLDETGFLTDFKELKETVNFILVDRLDHKMLNNVLEYNPTSENMAVDMLKRLRATDKRFVRVELWETPTSSTVAKIGE